VVAPEERVKTLELIADSTAASSDNPTDFAALARESISSPVAVGASVVFFVFTVAIDVDSLLSGV